MKDDDYRRAEGADEYEQDRRDLRANRDTWTWQTLFVGFVGAIAVYVAGVAAAVGLLALWNWWWGG